jgi:hypothetical protein
VVSDADLFSSVEIDSIERGWKDGVNDHATWSFHTTATESRRAAETEILMVSWKVPYIETTTWIVSCDASQERSNVALRQMIQRKYSSVRLSSIWVQ